MYIEMAAPTRFSDFGRDGCLHFSKCLMYFEKARFLIAKDAGLDCILRESYPGKRVQFVIIKTDVKYLSPVPVSYDREGGLLVRSSLTPPFISKLAFVQELTDAGTGDVLIHADIDVALLLDGEGMISSINQACCDCLQSYYDRCRAGIRIRPDLSDVNMRL